VAAESGPVDTPAGPGVLIELDRAEPGTLHEQLERRLRELVRSGRLGPGARMPSTRTLATELNISRGVVLEAYTQLVAEGYLTASQGAPTRVAFAAGAEPPPAAAGAEAPRYRYDLDPTLPDLASFPRDQWLRSVRAATRRAAFAELGHGDPRGTADLRNELMAYLGRVRGAAPEPEHTLICGGFTHGFALLCRLLAERGIEQIAIEAPGYPRHRLIAEAVGLQPLPVPVDEHGIVVEALAGSETEVVVVTPAHQFPTGAVLSAERRTALLEWAEERDALVVEDDYDSELRYDREPVGALQGLAPERVCQIGSMSKRLVPALRLGWILSPSWLTGGLTYAQGIAGGGAPVLDQLALADFIARGELDRHLRRMRLLYRARREVLGAALTARVPRAHPIGVPAGVFTLVEIPQAGVTAAALIVAAAARGVGVEAIESPNPEGGLHLVLGFGALPDAAIRAAIELLSVCIP
jgi:GntR family transcriptional regulator/MocR family aminotransferase